MSGNRSILVGVTASMREFEDAMQRLANATADVSAQFAEFSLYVRRQKEAWLADHPYRAAWLDLRQMIRPRREVSR